MSTVCGVSIAKDLAVVVAMGDCHAQSTVCLPGSDKSIEYRMFTHADGRAFVGSPYLGKWKSTHELLVHESGQEVDVTRIVSELMHTYKCTTIGYDPAQMKLAYAQGKAISRSSHHLTAALAELNVRAREFDGYLFPADSCGHYMWNSLPTDGDERILPSEHFVASGRYDLITAMLNAMAAGRILEEEEAAEEARCFAAYEHDVEKRWESIDPQTMVCIVMNAPRTRRVLPMRDALPILKARQATLDEIIQ